MNTLKGLLAMSSALLLWLALSGFAQAGNLHEDLVQLAGTDTEPPFSASDLGFDNHRDVFYYDDGRVGAEYNRRNYLATKLTLAGQAPDSTGNPVKPAVNPFGIAQRTYKGIKVLMDRWDVKESANGMQLIAFYHGKGSIFVVDKLRAHLLRLLGNALNDFVPQLDRIGKSVEEEEEDDDDEDSDDESDDESDASDASNRYPKPTLEDTDKDVKQVMDQVRGTIERVFKEVDTSIRNDMADNDDSKSTATIAIVTKNYVITAAVGNGKVIGYDESSVTHVLTPNKDNVENEFGLKKTRKDFIHPHVAFYSRALYKFNFLILETPSVAAKLPDKTASLYVTSQIQQLKHVDDSEQDIFSHSLLRIVGWLEDNIKVLERLIAHSDYSVALVGLERDYNSIF